MQGTPGLPFLLQEGREVAFVPPVLDAPRRARVAAVRPEGARTYLVRFAGVDDIAAASLLVGCHCLVRRADLAEEELLALSGADAWDGWEVHDRREGLVGTVAGVEESPGQHLLAVDRPDGARTLIPLVDEFVVFVDEDALRIQMDLPDGLLDL